MKGTLPTRHGGLSTNPNAGSAREVGPSSAGRQALEEIALDRIEADPLLLHRVARPDRDRLILESLEVDRDAERCADLVLTAIAAADRAGVVELDIPPLPQH